ncbi:MAG TPA: dynamin family protein, partial [Pseudogracilibacillus sp.]|nr:dynamin family protein [Pseudogracilibacillus sp.]
LYEHMKENNDKVNADKIIDLYEKQQKNEFNISFSGHFSAGKSSMINYLLGKDVLPKSPIPTSANIVKITSGEGVARVYFTESDTVQYKEPYDLDMIKDYATDKNAIKRIDISTSEAILPENCAILDTPGIDAADDADRLMTESALHLVDVLYYVMDYNHVQSEVNLYFLRKMHQAEIPFYVIINQVDKHNENEITFEKFDKNVRETFDQWNIFPEKIYYSSVMTPDAAHSEITSIKDDLFHLLNKDKNINKRLKAASNIIINDHETYLKELLEEEVNNIVPDDISDEEYDLLQNINQKMAEVHEPKEHLKNEFDHELDHTLKNAYLMPAKLRDQAKVVLESQQKDFKVGFFNAKKKTEEERTNRMNDFLTELQKTIDSAIQWKLRDKYIEMLRESDIHDDALLQKVQNLKVDYDESNVLSFMKEGAQINGNYVLNYTNDISNDIKMKYRQKVNDLWASIEQTIKEDKEKQIEQLQTQLKEFTFADELLAKKAELEAALAQKLAQLKEDVKEPEVNDDIIVEMDEAIESRHQVIEKEAPKVEKTVVEEKQAVKEVETVKVATDKAYTAENIITTIDQVTNELLDVDGFNTIVRDLKEKKHRLENRQLTIALFGAFSAGKSSFSNALFGEQVLPVSPNPTTAVISRINPITDNYKHGTVVIQLKDDATLTEDLKAITKDFEPDYENVHEMVEWIKRYNIHKNDTLTKTYQSYLLAVLTGYEQRKNQLGKTVEISLEQFPAFVTDESKACYIEQVDLYYDCALTRKGITLVDTPGADSVNARHTNVSFDYIKDADAIIYVTYYNHAITSADRDFLMQLGRVKEAFELDKMFFIVNASDLAQDKTELQLVLDYVEEQLLQFGVRQAKIFPVSSMLSLKDKIEERPLNDEMAAFEDDFYTFIEQDLAQITIQSAVWDMNRAATTLQNFIESANLSESERAAFVKKLEEKRTQFKNIVAKTNSSVAEERILERIERQLHYVLERLYIRFHDMFSEHFNPTTVKGSGREAMKLLEHNRNQFIDYVGYELLQEVRAVSLRVEANMHELVKNTFDEIQHSMGRIDEQFLLPSLQEIEFDTPVYEQAFTELDLSIFQQALKIFKNTRSFFEHNEREKMKDAFYETLKPEAKVYLDEQKATMNETYVNQWNEALTTLKERIENEVDAMIDQNIKVVTDTVNIQALENKHTNLQTILKEV